MAILEAIKSFAGIESSESAVVFDNFEDLVRERAYLLWEKAGCPEGDGVEFWVLAERELTSS